MSFLHCVLLTGGTGFIGSRVLAHLVTSGHKIVLLHRSTTNKRNLDLLVSQAPDLILPFVGDVKDPKSLRSCFRAHPDVDCVIHMACVSSWKLIEETETVFRTAVGGTENLLRAAASETTSPVRFIYVSSLAATGGAGHVGGRPPRSLKYACAKYDAESLVLCYPKISPNIQPIIIRPGEVYGRDDHQMITAKNVQDYAANPLPVTFCVSGGVSIARKEDVAAAIVACVVRGVVGKTYELGGDNLTIREYAQEVQRITHSRKPIICINGSLAYFLSKLTNLLGLGLFDPEAVKYGRCHWFTNSQDAVEDLQYVPRPASEVFGEVISWLAEPRK